MRFADFVDILTYLDRSEWAILNIGLGCLKKTQVWSWGGGGGGGGGGEEILKQRKRVIEDE